MQSCLSFFPLLRQIWTSGLLESHTFPAHTCRQPWTLLGTGWKGEVSSHCCLGPRLLGMVVPILFCSFGSSSLSQHNLGLSLGSLLHSDHCGGGEMPSALLSSCPALESSVKLFWALCHQLQRWFEWVCRADPRRNVALWPWCPAENKRSSPNSSVPPLEERHAGHNCAHVSGGSHTLDCCPLRVPF